MKQIIKVSAWESLLLNFSRVFTKPTAEIFSDFLTAWVLATGRRTVCGIFWFVRDRQLRAHDAYHRFFSRASWKMEDLWRTWAVWVIAHLATEGIVHLILDDTVYRRTGRKVCGAGWWRDAVRSTAGRVVHVWGLNLVVLAVRIDPFWGGEPIAIPIHLAVHRKDGPTLMELAAAIVNEVQEWCPLCHFSLSADGFYSSLAGRKLPARLISRMRWDAAIFDLPPARRPHQRGPNLKKGDRLPAPKDMRPRTWRLAVVMERGKCRKRLLYERIVIWYKVLHTSVKLVISRDPEGKEQDDFFFTTDLTQRAEDVVSEFAGRWCIEDTFRNVKQVVRGQEPQVWKREGPERAAALGFLLYGLVWAWALSTNAFAKGLKIAPWYPAKATPSFTDALGMLRKTIWMSRIIPMSGRGVAHASILRLFLHALTTAA